MNKKKGEAPSATTHFVLSYVRVQSQNIESGLKWAKARPFLRSERWTFLLNPKGLEANSTETEMQ